MRCRHARQTAPILGREGVADDSARSPGHTDQGAMRHGITKRTAKLQGREKWITWAKVDDAIVETNAELEEVKQQLGEKRSLLGKLLGRNRTAGA